MKKTKIISPLFVVLSLVSVTLSALAKDLPDPDGKPADMSKPVKVFLIMGQSNTLEMGRVMVLVAALVHQSFFEVPHQINLGTVYRVFLLV